MQNYFQLYDIEQSYNIDLKLLERKYFTLQQKYHPDLSVGKSDAEKIEAAQYSVTINKAYQVLKDDLKRAEYLLSLLGVLVNVDGKGVLPCKILLMEIMEMREELLEANQIDDITKLGSNAEDELIKSTNRINEAFKSEDLELASQTAIKMRYLKKFLDEVRIKKLGTGI